MGTKAINVLILNIQFRISEVFQCCHVNLMSYCLNCTICLKLVSFSYVLLVPELRRHFRLVIIMKHKSYFLSWSVVIS